MAHSNNYKDHNEESFKDEIIYKKSGLSDEKRKTVLDKLRNIVSNANVSDREIDKISYSRDCWPITLRWFLEGKIAALPDFIVWPETTSHVSQIVALANQEKIPIVPFGEGSGVLGGAIPTRGGIVLDMKKMSDVLDIDESNLTVTAQTGINGMNFERALNREGYTLGHFPQSLYCSTLGGWLACKAAGQYSTKYGKIDDMVVSLEAVLPQGETIRSKPAPKPSTGPQIEALLLGSEGTLGIITEATLKIWPTPEKSAYHSYAFPSLGNGLEAIRLILRRGLYPAVVRLYNKAESARHFHETKDAKGKCMLILVMEGTEELVNLEEKTSREMCKGNGGVPCGEEPVNHWLATRFNVKEISEFAPRDVVFDTIEVSVGWDKSQTLYDSMISAMRSVEGVILASAHASHFYPQGVCFYFTFGGVAINDEPYEFYSSVWDAAMRACIEAGGSISHHHGIGLMRSSWLPAELGTRFEVLKKIKETLDPNDIMNPGKMGL